jgi:hypothetical protein
MRFLLDMGLASSTGRFLRSRGHDAVHLREQGLQRLQVLVQFADQLSAGASISVHEQGIRVRLLPVSGGSE